MLGKSERRCKVGKRRKKEKKKVKVTKRIMRKGDKSKEEAKRKERIANG